MFASHLSMALFIGEDMSSIKTMLNWYTQDYKIAFFFPA
jgi:tryptophanase leader peptide